MKEKEKNLLFKDDAFGDKIGCCPNCENPFNIPLKVLFSKNKPSSFPCSNCGQLVKI